MSVSQIRIRGARQHNLRDIHLSLPRDSLVVITGVSGSGKSSLAFDTLYAEGQRRYVESLSTYARQFVGQMDRADVDAIEGLSPAIAIDQRSLGRSPRSTVGTATEIHDFLRVLFARAGTPHCPHCGTRIQAVSLQGVKDRLRALPQGTGLRLYAPVVRGEKGSHRRLFQRLARHGYLRVRVDGEIRELDEEIHLDRESSHTIEVLVDRLEIRAEASVRLADSLETTSKLSEGLILAEIAGGEAIWFSQVPFCVGCGYQIPELTPKLFSFNDPLGACASCKGLGFHKAIDPQLVVPDRTRSLRDGALAPWAHRHPVLLMQELEDLASHGGFDIYSPFGELPEPAQRLLLHGSDEERIAFRKIKGDRATLQRKPFQGVVPWLEKAWRDAKDPVSKRAVERFMSLQPCPACNGARLGPEALGVRMGGASIQELCGLPIGLLKNRLETLALHNAEQAVAQGLLREVKGRLGLLESLGLSYLSLDRSSETLSGGEAQRIRLATHMGSILVGVLYILDEPSVGLHAKDQARLLETLRRMRDGGNSVVVVEHDAETILAADYVVDMGPGAGEMGGSVVYAGPPQGLMGCPESLTGAYLSGRTRIPVPSRRREAHGACMEVVGASQHNLKGISVRFPLGCLTVVTGVSGSGKSSLVLDTLYRAAARRLRGGHGGVLSAREIRGLEAVNKVIDVDQSPIGRTPRSNPATYAGVFQPIRQLFAQLPESRMRGYGAGRFSFNAKGGRCEACQGEGVRRIEMHFLPDVYATCEACQGTRYNEETLEIRFKGLNVAQILGLTVSEALRLFENVPRICGVLQTLHAVGLGYLRLGQAATSLSGGEAQRVKLAKELCRPQTGRTLYILDEPTTGLHFEDIRRLLDLLGQLLETGNTVVVIEHNMELIKCADWLIDLGPGGGDEGGWVVASGTPEEVAMVETSITGQYLRKVLHPQTEGKSP